MPSRFRSSFTQREGNSPATVAQGRVVNVNRVNWTVDVRAQYDRKRWCDIQVGSPYLHYANGEGLSAFPEVGATCMVCIPGDSSPPFVQCFLMPHEMVTDAATPDAPQGTRSHGAPAKFASDASFAGGRPVPTPGDIFLRGRDKNFVVLHRGGVLQIGSTELAQRLYIPLNNFVTDMAENYAMHNAGGSILWGLQDGPSQAHFPSQYLHTFRVFADDKYADVRIAIGKVYTPVPEPDGGSSLSAAGVGGSDDNPIICEVTVAPQGFVPESGATANAGVPKQTVFKFIFDRKGNTFLRCEGNLTMLVKQKLTITASSDVAFTTSTSLSMGAKNGIDIDGGAYSHIKGGVVRLGQGSQPVARVGDLVQTLISVPVPIVVTFPIIPLPGVPTPGVMIVGAPGAPFPLVGSIVFGNSLVLA